MPALKALTSQIFAWLIVVVLLSSGALPAPSLLALAMLQGGLAAGIGLMMKSARWWLPIHLAFSPALLVANSLQIHPVWFLGAFLLLALVYWSSFRTQVPLYLSNAITMEAVSELLPADRPIHFLDVGSGTGGLLRHLALKRPDCRIDGIESAPIPCLVAWLATRGLPNCRAIRGDFWKTSLADYDVVYAFLSPVPMPRLWAKARTEMRPGSLLIANSFPVPDAEPEQTLTLPDRRATRLYLYRIPGIQK